MPSQRSAHPGSRRDAGVRRATRSGDSASGQAGVCGHITCLLVFPLNGTFPIQLALCRCSGGRTTRRYAAEVPRPARMTPCPTYANVTRLVAARPGSSAVPANLKPPPTPTPPPPAPPPPTTSHPLTPPPPL